MPKDNALYVYGIVKGLNPRWEKTGINEKHVYTINEGKFMAIVHDCEEKPYLSEDPYKIKELIIIHNHILDKAMEDFSGVIPLSFNTIIKKGEDSSKHNLKKWLNEEKEGLEKKWSKIKGKREYGIRIYYEKDKLIKESMDTKGKELEENLQGKSKGLNYLLREKVKSRINEIVQRKINQFKQQFYDDIKEITENIKVNISRISIDEEKDLLCSLSILVDQQKISEIKQILEKKRGDSFSFQFAGPFAPYSFVENETKY